MPELPDVELRRRHLHATSVGRAVVHVHVHDPSLLTGTSRQQLAARLVGRVLDRTRRHGKHLGLHAGPNGDGDSAGGSDGDDGGWLRLHFGMTGDLVSRQDGAPANGPPSHAALTLELDDGGRLHVLDRRRLGEIGWVPDFDRFVAERDLGPDALDVGLEDFRDRLAHRQAAIKSVLLDQGTIAGVGNVYADEALLIAGIRPDRAAEAVTEREAGSLHRALRHVLRTAIDRGADPEAVPATWILPRREPGADCPRCGRPLERGEVSGRATYRCPRCQH
jgi:formamidopyrimidine-DNA glycosylase